MAKWKPTAAQAAFVRKYAKDTTGCGRIKIEPGERVAFDGKDWIYSLNEYMLTDCEESDLSETLEWSDFLKGVELDADGKAEIDFYVYSVSQYEQNLITNVGCHYCATSGEFYVFGTGTSKKYL